MSAKSVLIILAVLAVSGLILYETWPPSNPPATVPKVDLSRYVGLWYEISSIPFFWSQGCNCTTANYSFRVDGDIQVINSCVKDGALDSYTGRAWAVDSTNSKLKVEFFWPFSGDYWIVALEANYDWVVISNPYREYLWILSRKPVIEESLHQNILTYLNNTGFPVEQLQVTDQSCYSLIN